MNKFQKLKKNNEAPSIKGLYILYNELQSMKKKSYVNKNETLCKEVVELIFDYLIYGDKNDQNIFELV